MLFEIIDLQVRKHSVHMYKYQKTMYVKRSFSIGEIRSLSKMSLECTVEIYKDINNGICVLEIHLEFHNLTLVYCKKSSTTC